MRTGTIYLTVPAKEGEHLSVSPTLILQVLALALCWRGSVWSPTYLQFLPASFFSHCTLAENQALALDPLVVQQFQSDVISVPV